MIDAVDETIEEFLRNEVPELAKGGDIEVSFEAPKNEWAGDTRGRFNAFLWDVRRSPQESQSGNVTIGRDGVNPGSVKMMPPRVACRYVLSAWLPDVKNEHRLLGDVLEKLLPLHQFPEAYLNRELATIRPLPDLRTASANAADYVDFWTALHGTIKVGIDLVVTITVDSGASVPRGALIGGRRSRVRNTAPRDEHRPLPWNTPKWAKAPVPNYVETVLRGGRVADFASEVDVLVTAPDLGPGESGDATIVRPDGTFWIRAKPGDEIVVHTDPPKNGFMPDDGPLIIED